jgi:omega-amidase
MQDLNVTLIQTELYWEDAAANLAMLEEKIWQIKDPTDLIILPEMFNSGFTMNAAAVAEPMNLTTFKWMKQQAAQTGAVVTGSFVVREDNKFYNRLVWMEPDGSYDYYDKRHLFRMAEEHQTYSAGNKRLIKTLKGWRICPMVCYDLRFPVWSRNRNNEFDLLIYVANWPASRSKPWDILLQARAVENLCYVAGVNRVGTDGKGIDYTGYSTVVNFKGDKLFIYDEGQAFIHTEVLDRESLEEFRKKFPAYLDADTFTIG